LTRLILISHMRLRGRQDNSKGRECVLVARIMEASLVFNLVQKDDRSFVLGLYCTIHSVCEIIIELVKLASSTGFWILRLKPIALYDHPTKFVQVLTILPRISLTLFLSGTL
jgi:hypothetical protein